MLDKKELSWVPTVLKKSYVLKINSQAHQTEKVVTAASDAGLHGNLEADAALEIVLNRVMKKSEKNIL